MFMFYSPCLMSPLVSPTRGLGEMEKNGAFAVTVLFNTHNPALPLLSIHSWMS